MATPPVAIDMEIDSEHAGALIEAGGIHDEGEFTPSDYDEGSIADSASSIGSSIYQHSFHNGRRYHKFRYMTALAETRIARHSFKGILRH